MIVVDASVLAVALGDDGTDGRRARERLTDETLAAPELIDLEVASAWRRHVAARLMTVPHTSAGTRSAVVRISWRSVVNFEIVLVATEATGRELRPVGSVLDTITTLSM